ncbi:TetR family transcriptional regulator C-terminal domain-containing protein [Winogradskyella immobilis]|uniref:TetR/AcrR family transcriptional regulator n=1 Tax=Winogradskyella immobilis TaxID=2816852 RepID=A0ABS8EPM6_9FLAO|nr:TetR family transcriptional regulator C-terminal domain-containing protein [Winogradskyella immobilis]MCC1484272.1 TetR/AcrR family transcriptional regulator [Winogradskyella immobilis]MCG0016364.1 TetR/AcrR family transcriptional regulator [Winogradskyella immobilis]
MAKKRTISQSEIIELYMNHVLIHNENPKTIYIFAKENNFEEQRFYEFFTSFESLEQCVFKTFFDNAHSILEKSNDYLNFDARNKLLSFYYTFFEILTANRSYVIYALENNKTSLKSLRNLGKLKKRFSNYIEHLNIKTLDLKQERLIKLQDQSLKESAWVQLLITIKFWLDDTSASFEKTDLFIEKSVRASFDLIDVAPLKSIIDLGKFLYKEKVQMN